MLQEEVLGQETGVSRTLPALVVVAGVAYARQVLHGLLQHGRRAGLGVSVRRHLAAFSLDGLGEEAGSGGKHVSQAAV